MIGKLVGMAFEFFEDTFDVIPISMGEMLNS